jgi:hypothetical protein
MKFLLIALTLIMFFVAPAFSQKGPPPAAARVNTERIRQQEMSSREWQLRNITNEPVKDQRQLKALMAQTEEDFNRILELHNEIARAISSNNGLDYRFVSEATGEIKKRASRVQSSLRLTPEEGHASPKLEDFSDVQMKDALIKLCKQIRGFVTNPSIEHPNTIDANQLAKARTDLEGVIQLSGQIKKDADKLSKAHP